MAFISIDSFQYIPTLEKAVAIARSSINLPVGGFNAGDSVGRYFPADKVARLEEALATAEALLTSNDNAAKLSVISELNQARQAMEDAVITVTIPTVLETAVWAPSAVGQSGSKAQWEWLCLSMARRRSADQRHLRF